MLSAFFRGCLKNGDKLHAEKIEQNTDSVKIHHEILGSVVIPREKISSISQETAAAPAKKEICRLAASARERRKSEVDSLGQSG